MPIPYDHEDRWWCEASTANPRLVSELRPALIAFLAFGPDGEPKIVGSGFISSSMQGAALAITAKHVLFEGALSIQRPLPRHALSSPFVPNSSVTPSAEPEKLKIIWMGQQSAALLNTEFIGANTSLDAATVICTPQDSDRLIFQPTSIPFDTAIPNVGDVVHMYSLNQLRTSERFSPDFRSGTKRFLSITKGISIRVGVVTQVYPNGFRQFRWPCFTTSIPAEPGMSGGVVTIPTSEKTICACGIVCADLSSDESRSNVLEQGESVIASTWPMLTLVVPDSIPSNLALSSSTIYNFMRSGRMPMAIGGLDHIDLIELENGDFRIRNSNQ